MLDLRIDGALVVGPATTPRVESIGVVGESIVAIGDLGSISAKAVIDAGGSWALPGAIDTHVHLGFTDQDVEWSTETALAAVGGVTTPLIYFRSTGSYEGILEDFIADGDRLAAVDFAVHLGILQDDHLESFDYLIDRFGIRSIKMYTTYKNGELRRFGVIGQDDGFIVDVMRAAARRGDVVVNVHCENDDIITRGQRLWGGDVTDPIERWSTMRPPLAEVEAIRRMGLFARETGARLHLPHVGSTQALEAALSERALGAQISVETCPHYLRPELAVASGNSAKVNPPVRPDQDGEAMWAAIGSGRIDTLGTDHACLCLADKTGPVEQARPGFPGLGTLLPVIMDGVIAGRMSLSHYARCMARAAEVFDLPQHGRLAPGYRADIVLVDPDVRRRVKAKSLGGYSDLSPFEGCELTGWPVRTILRGRTVAEEGEIVGDPRGRYVRQRQ
jgi:dihydroorotase (multifunctional complex type)